MNESKNHLLRFKYFFFDLDNTLYDENQYLFGAYKGIGKIVSDKYDYDRSIISDYLKNEFLATGRHKLFDKLINKYGLEKSYLNACLSILRSYQFEEKIELFKEMSELLKEISNITTNLFIVTNGNVLQQKNKIAQIEWNDLEFKEIVFANNFVPKPSGDSLEYLIRKYRINREESIFVGDSKPDALCASSANVKFLDVNDLLTVNT